LEDSNPFFFSGENPFHRRERRERRGRQDIKKIGDRKGISGIFLKFSGHFDFFPQLILLFLGVFRALCGSTAEAG